jgi:hypothetical protein
MVANIKSLIAGAQPWQTKQPAVTNLVWGFVFERYDTARHGTASLAADGCQIQIPDYCGISLASNIYHCQYSGLGI